MENESSANSYEEARKQRLLDNKRRFEDLGILKLSKSLSDVKKSVKPQPQPCRIRSKQIDIYTLEPRRSSRERNSVASYRDDFGIELPPMRKRSSNWNSSWASYLARPVEEVKTATYEERARALKSAEKLQSNLGSDNPSFVKSMVRSHVYSCFWLGLPTGFCKDHLPKSTANTDVVLEDEEGSEYEAIYISTRTGLSGGWRAFALEHKLDDGDALVFELVEPTRFKVYIVRAFQCQTEDDNMPAEVENAEETPKAKKHKKKTDNEQSNDSEKPKKEKPQVSATRRSLRRK